MPGPAIFADANFLLYVLDERDPAKQARAAAWHDLLWREDRGRTSMQVVSEVYVNLKRMAGAHPSPWSTMTSNAFKVAYWFRTWIINQWI